VTYHAPVPVGTACRQLVPPMGSPTRRNPLFAARLETRPIVVWRPPQPHVAADDFRQSPIRLRRSWITRRFLETGLATEQSIRQPQSAPIRNLVQPWKSGALAPRQMQHCPGVRPRPAPTQTYVSVNRFRMHLN